MDTSQRHGAPKRMHSPTQTSLQRGPGLGRASPRPGVGPCASAAPQLRTSSAFPVLSPCTRVAQSSCAGGAGTLLAVKSLCAAVSGAGRQPVGPRGHGTGGFEPCEPCSPSSRGEKPRALLIGAREASHGRCRRQLRCHLGFQHPHPRLVVTSLC